MLLRAKYHLKAIPIIAGFVQECALFFGAQKEECYNLRLAAEEAAVKIIESFPGDIDEVFEITCSFSNGIFKIILNNRGIPINKNNLPEYKSENPEKTFDGISFHLIKNLCDNFYFVNRGREGWQSVIEKKLKNGNNVIQEKKEKENEPAPEENLKATIATPEDAYNLTKLAYLTYGYSYAKTEFYYPELLEKAIENKQIIPFIVKNSKNEIVVHTAFLRSPHCTEVLELGAGMVRPEYRKQGGTKKTIALQWEYIEKHKNSIQFIETNLVTSHTRSQMITFTKLGFTPLCIKPSVHEQGIFKKIKEKKAQRESHIYGAKFIKTDRLIKIPALAKHIDFLNLLFKDTVLKTEFVLPEKNSKNTISEFETRLKKNYQLSDITVKSIGKNFFKELRKLIFDLDTKGYLTFYLRIPCNENLSELNERKLNREGFFFCGIIPRKLNQWFLLYAKLQHQDFKISNINVFGEKAELLKDYVSKEFEKIFY